VITLTVPVPTPFVLRFRGGADPPKPFVFRHLSHARPVMVLFVSLTRPLPGVFLPFSERAVVVFGGPEEVVFSSGSPPPLSFAVFSAILTSFSLSSPVLDYSVSFVLRPCFLLKGVRVHLTAAWEYALCASSLTFTPETSQTAVNFT